MKKQYITPQTTVYQAIVSHSLLSASPMESEEFSYGGRSSDFNVLEADTNIDMGNSIWN